MFGKILSAFVATLAVAGAYTTPKGDPSGNPIYTPGLNQIVPVSQPFKVTWNATTPGTVTLVLLRGPSTNVIPLYPIAEGIANSGSYEWTPKSDLENDTTHYGLQLIVDATGQYQYSTQFGISNPGYSGSGSSSSSSPSATTVHPTGSVSLSSTMSGVPVNSTVVVSPNSSQPAESSSGHATVTGASGSAVTSQSTAVLSTSTRASSTSTGAAVVNTNAAALIDLSVGSVVVGLAAAVFAL